MEDLPPTFVPGFHNESEIRKMKYNDFGATGMKVSHLSIGTGGFCGFYGEYTIEDCKATLQKAIKSGINYIDTAPWYGHGVSEEVLGKCLQGIPRQAYYIATKVGRYEADPKLMFDFSAEKTKASIERSLQKLGVEYIDLIQVHDIEFAPSLDVVIQETLPVLEQSVKAGKAKFVGVTGYPVSTLDECIKKSKTKIDAVGMGLGHNPNFPYPQPSIPQPSALFGLTTTPSTMSISPTRTFGCITSRFKYIELFESRSYATKRTSRGYGHGGWGCGQTEQSRKLGLWPVEDMDSWGCVESKNLGVISAAGHCMGLLTNNGAQSWHPAPKDIKSACAEAREYCQLKGVELAKLAIYYCFQQHGPHTHLVGMNTCELLNSNLDVLYNGLTDLEKAVLEYLQNNIFLKLERGDWEGENEDIKRTLSNE